MSRIEQVNLFRSQFRLGDDARKTKIVLFLRDYGINFLQPAVIAKVPRAKSDDAREWDLTIAIDASEFSGRARNTGLSRSQLSAADVVMYCTLALENNAVPEQLWDWIINAYVGLDLDAVEGRKKSIKALVNARRVAAENKTSKAAQYHKEWREWAKNIYKVFPYSNNSDVANKVAKLANDAGHKMANGNPYALATVNDVITGVKKGLKNNSQK
jgi:hypothetical protein